MSLAGSEESNKPSDNPLVVASLESDPAKGLDSPASLETGSEAVRMLGAESESEVTKVLSFTGPSPTETSPVSPSSSVKSGNVSEGTIVWI